MRKPIVSQPPPASWSMPKRMIGIAALPRSGSTYLADLMTNTGLLGQPNEFYNPHVLRKQFPGRGKTLADCAMLARELGTSPNDVVGIKFFAAHFPSTDPTFKISDWFGEPVWVWLRRRDMLGQAISFLIARQTLAYTANATAQSVPKYSSVLIAETLHKCCVQDAQWRAYFNRTQISPLEIEYEDLTQDPESALRKIAEVAGIELGPVEAQPRSTMQKQRTSLNDEWRARFVETSGDPDVLETGRRMIRGALGNMLARFYEPK